MNRGNEPRDNSGLNLAPAFSTEEQGKPTQSYRALYNPSDMHRSCGQGIETGWASCRETRQSEERKDHRSETAGGFVRSTSWKPVQGYMLHKCILTMECRMSSPHDPLWRFNSGSIVLVMSLISLITSLCFFLPSFLVLHLPSLSSTRGIHRRNSIHEAFIAVTAFIRHSSP
jgi:hypothetical protein